MAQKVFHHELNVGVVDEDKQHRVDLEKMRLATLDQTNVIGTVTGKGLVRPGFKYLSANRNSGRARLIPFVAGAGAAFQLELTDLGLRVRNGTTDALVTRAAVTATITSGDFSAATGWTLSAASGQSSAISGGVLTLAARAHGAEASATASFTINETATDHAVEIVVTRGPVLFRLGTSAGAQDLIAEVSLRKGKHSLAFSPGGAVTGYIKFSNTLPVSKIVDSITIAAAGAMVLPTMWPVADLNLIRFDQSLDVMFLAARGYKQQRIERHGDASWSVCDYDADDGPFLVGRTAQVTLISDVLEGNGTLTASAPFFTANHVGALFNLAHEGQRLDTYLAGPAQFTNVMEITGVNETSYNDRDWTWTVAGTWAGTLRVQRSFDSEDAGFQQFRSTQGGSTIDITANAGPVIDDDNEDNAIGWYRMGFEAGTYTSGEAHVTAQYAGGGGFGICRITGVTDSTHASIEILKPFVGNYATDDWREGAWSNAQGWPSAVRFTEGRLVWSGADKVWGSISDAFESFDETFDGEAGPLLRSIAIGGRNTAVWMLNLSSLIVGTDSRVVTVRANSLDDTITPSNFKVVNLGKVSSAEVDPVDLADNRALFVQGAGVTIFEINYDASQGAFLVTPFSKLSTDLFSSGISDVAMTAIPDQRIWITNANDDAVCLTFEDAEKVQCFAPMAVTDGDIIESVCALPGLEQERVYASISRVVNGVTVHYTEKLALDREAAPNAFCAICDSYVGATGAHSATVDLPHLKGRTVVAWVDGAPVETSRGVRREFTVNVVTGQITLPVAPTTGYCVGVPYDWRVETARLEYGVPNQTPMLDVKAIAKVSILLADVARNGILIGTRNADGQESPFDHLPKLTRGKTATEVQVGKAQDDSPYPVPGGASLDNRLIIKGSSPYPASILGYIIDIENLR